MLVVPEATQVVPPTQQTGDGENVNISQTSSQSSPNPALTLPQPTGSKKRTCDEVGLESSTNRNVNKKIREAPNTEGESRRKKKKGRNRERAGAS
jgi:hypothetical protein